MHLGSYSSGQRREVLVSANVEFWKLQLPRGHRLRGSFSFPSSWPSGLLLRDQRDWVSLEKTCILNWGVCGFCHIPTRFGGSSSQSQELPISLSPFLFPVETPPVSTRTLYSPTVILHCHSWCPWSPTVSSQHPLSETWASLCSAPSMCFTLTVTFLVFMLMEFHANGHYSFFPIHGVAQNWNSAELGFIIAALQLLRCVTSGRSYPLSGTHSLHLQSGDDSCSQS